MKIKNSTLRIIGGRWRSRKITFLPQASLRPTTDSTRETLFNWLAPMISGARCLDLFAGSGALGFEALSRGAAKVVMTDNNLKIIERIKDNAKTLEAENIEFYLAKIPQQLSRIPQEQFDLVFLDPPFNQNLLANICEKLILLNYLSKKALIYIEAEKRLAVIKLVPASWQLLRQKVAGLASSYLFKVENKQQ